MISEDKLGVRSFDDLPDGCIFADKFGRKYTKLGDGHARCHETFNKESETFTIIFDDSRDYYPLSLDEEDDWDMWDSWPFFILEEGDSK